GRHAERWRGNRRLGSAELPFRLDAARPTLSPNGCELGVRRGARVVVVPVDCAPKERRAYPGTSIAWSPDGRWLAVAGPNAIRFYHGDGPRPLAEWRLGAARLAWTSE